MTVKSTPTQQPDSQLMPRIPAGAASDPIVRPSGVNEQSRARESGWRLARLGAAGVAGGLLATAMELVYFYAPGRSHVPAELPYTLLLAAAIYFALGLGAGLLLGLTRWLLIPSQLTGVTRRKLNVQISVAAIAFLGLTLTLGQLSESLNHIATPFRRHMFISVGAACTSAAWLAAYHLAASRLAKTTAHSIRPFYCALILSCALSSWATIEAFTDPRNQPFYFLSIIGALTLPFASFVFNFTARAKRTTVGLLLIGTATLSTQLYVGVRPQSVYVLRIARTLPGFLARSLASIGIPPTTLPLHNMVRKRFHEVTTAAPPSSHHTVSAPTQTSASRPNILLLTVDTLRRDRISDSTIAYRVSPNIERFKQRATHFTHAFTTAGSTIGALSSLMTGRREHLVGHLSSRPGAIAQLALTTETIAQRLRRGGYTTKAFLGGKLISYFPSFSLGFDSALETDVGRKEPLSARRIVDLLVDALDRADGPLFLWGHIMELHDVPKTRANLHESYNDVVMQIDAELSRLFDRLDRSPGMLVVFTSDHGEGLGEGRLVAHALCHALTIQVPLIVRFPGYSPRQSAATVSHLDIAATIVEGASLPANDLVGRNLRAVASSGINNQHALFELATYSEAALPSEVGIALFPWFYSYDMRLNLPVLINLSNDPAGVQNLAGTGLQEEETLRELLTKSYSTDS